MSDNASLVIKCAAIVMVSLLFCATIRGVAKENARQDCYKAAGDNVQAISECNKNQ